MRYILWKIKLIKPDRRKPAAREQFRSSVKRSDPGQFLKSQGKFFFSFPCTLFYIFLTSKITDDTLKSFLGGSILHNQIRNI